MPKPLAQMEAKLISKTKQRISVGKNLFSK